MNFTVLFYDADMKNVLASIETNDPMAEVKKVLKAGGPEELFDENGELTVKVERAGRYVPYPEWVEGFDASDSPALWDELRATNPRRKAK
jgi:hypothetical protein